MMGEKAPQEETLRQKLDRAAEESRGNTGDKKSSIVQKATEYIPAPSAILPGSKSNEADKGGQADAAKSSAGNSEQSEDHIHDAHVEEFVRDQHRSNVDPAKP